MPSHKRERVSKLMLSFLAKELGEILDPRLTSVTLTAVDVTPDMKTAWVHFSATPAAEANRRNPEDPIGFITEQELKDIKAALQHWTGHLKKRVAQELDMRYTPGLSFRYDRSLEHGAKIDILLKKAGL